MSIREYITDLKLIDTIEFKIGSLYFFERFVVSEFNEGEHINFENFKTPSEIINSFYDERPFGFIANRINSYSIELNDTKKWNSTFPTLKAYAVVSERVFSHNLFILENKFFEYNRKIFENLDDAINWVETTLIEP